MNPLPVFNILANFLNSEEDLAANFSSDSISEIKNLYINADPKTQVTLYYRFPYVLSALFGVEPLSIPSPLGFTKKFANVGEIIFVTDDEENSDLLGLYFECIHSLENSVLVLDLNGEIREIHNDNYICYISVDSFIEINDRQRKEEQRRRDIEIWEQKGLSWSEIEMYEHILVSKKDPNKKLIEKFTDKHSFYYIEGCKQPKSELDLLFEKLKDNS